MAEVQKIRQAVQPLYDRLETIRMYQLELEDVVSHRYRDDLDVVEFPSELLLDQTITGAEENLHNFSRYAGLIAVCTVMEEAMMAIVTGLVENVQNQNNKKKGNWLEKNVDLLRNRCELDTTQINDDLNVLYNMISLRNCIAHGWGRVEFAHNPNDVRQAIADQQKRGKESNLNVVEETEGGYLFLGDQDMPEAIIAAEHILQHLFDTILRQGKTGPGID